ncbi:MAG: tryptophanase [Deltaproteobacteria bacterium]|nr:tryptophanase [Deltaproteobacteria bacterium]
MSHPEPFRIRSVEPIHLIAPDRRREALEQAGHNLFKVPARDVFIDLLTDSGTGCMSDQQWASLHCADESYAGSASFERFQAAVRDVTGFPEVIPTHQGRAAERIVCETLLTPGDVVVSNGLFDTTHANVDRVKAIGMDLPDPAALRNHDPSPLKGAIDLKGLESALEKERVRFAVLTCTSNSFGGHPVPLSNAREASRLCHARGVPLFIDAARFSENAGMLARRDPDCRGRASREIAREIFSLADGCMMSAKKNGLAHIGGFIALRDKTLADKLRENLIVTEGFETYGGLAGRDLDAIAIGLKESLDEDMLGQRLGQVERFHASLQTHGIPVVLPAGGHAVYVDAAALFPHIPAEQFPGHVLACALYLEGGVRTCEIGSLMFPPGARPKGSPELTRLAIPWRTYTDAHLEHVAETLTRIAAKKASLHGMKVVSAPPALRHFRAVLAPVG